jgi:hypothetical protein
VAGLTLAAALRSHVIERARPTVERIVGYLYTTAALQSLLALGAPTEDRGSATLYATATSGFCARAFVPQPSDAASALPARLVERWYDVLDELLGAYLDKKYIIGRMDDDDAPEGVLETEEALRLAHWASVVDVQSTTNLLSDVVADGVRPAPYILPHVATVLPLVVEQPAQGVGEDAAAHVGGPAGAAHAARGAPAGGGGEAATAHAVDPQKNALAVVASLFVDATLEDAWALVRMWLHDVMWYVESAPQLRPSIVPNVGACRRHAAALAVLCTDAFEERVDTWVRGLFNDHGEPLTDAELDRVREVLALVAADVRDSLDGRGERGVHLGLAMEMVEPLTRMEARTEPLRPGLLPLAPHRTTLMKLFASAATRLTMSGACNAGGADSAAPDIGERRRLAVAARRLCAVLDEIKQITDVSDADTAALDELRVCATARATVPLGCVSKC